jgi:hypothetical protein
MIPETKDAAATAGKIDDAEPDQPAPSPSTDDTQSPLQGLSIGEM